MNKAASALAHGHSDTAKSTFGFWLYLMTDCILFASLFATYVVLRDNTFGGPGGQELFSLPYILVATLLLLTSSFTSGLAVLAARKGLVSQVLLWLAFTFVLGAAFIAMEFVEFSQLVQEGNSWQRSGFLTAFFTLVGTHGLHILVGLLWLTVLAVQLMRRGLTGSSLKRLTLFSMFWHFLDVVWILIFTIVYLMGVA